MPEGVSEVVLSGERLTIERVGGTEVVSAPGRPYAVVSQVEIEYRPAPAAAAGAAAPLTSHDPIRGDLVHILVADDDTVSRTLLVRTLEHLGHEVDVVGDGLEACRRLIAPGAASIAILDWSMPGLEGPEVCRQSAPRTCASSRTS